MGFGVIFTVEAEEEHRFNAVTAWTRHRGDTPQFSESPMSAPPRIAHAPDATRPPPLTPARCCAPETTRSARAPLAR